MGFVEDDKYSVVPGGTMSLGELYKVMDPNKDSMPYVYDSFEWEHCEGIGFDFRGGLPAGQSKLDTWIREISVGATAITEDQSSGSSSSSITMSSSPN